MNHDRRSSASRSPMLARVTVAVVGSGTHEHEPLARPVGQLLAGLGVNLLTGGGAGVMTSVSRSFIESRHDRGISIGIIPCRSEGERARPKDGYPSRYVELAIYTHLPYSGTRGKDDLSRNHINVLSSAAVIALPGEHGTAAEVSLAIEYGKPVVVYSPDASLVAHFPAAATRVGSLDEVRHFLRRFVVTDA